MTKEHTNKALSEMVSIDPIEFYDAFHYHVGHKIEIHDVWDWTTNRETSIEIRCMEQSCTSCEPLFEMDMPKE